MIIEKDGTLISEIDYIKKFLITLLRRGKKVLPEK